MKGSNNLKKKGFKKSPPVVTNGYNLKSKKDNNYIYYI